MKKFREIAVTLTLDFIYFVLAWYIFYLLRFELGIVSDPEGGEPRQLLLPGIVIAVYWIVIFSIFGLYRKLYLISRFDEILRVAKITIIGTLILFFILFIDSLGWTAENLSMAKTVTLVYWLTVFILVGTNRFILRTIQKIRVQKGKGLHRALIVGVGLTAQSVYEKLERHKESGMNVLGYISGKNGQIDPETTAVQSDKILGNLENLNDIIKKNDVQDIIVALEEIDRDYLIHVLDQVDVPDVSIKILPDFHQVISGLNQTNQIFGLPLIEVMPDPMPSWEKFVKRMLDILLSLLALAVMAVPMVIIMVIIRLTSSGPAIYQQERVGKYGKVFTIFKFRTMSQDAEVASGPTWAEQDDPRITKVGYWLRKLRLDEFPQFFNVLKGEMSLVGPRPERQFFVDEFKKEIPLYTRRLRVKPGITGWAQVKWKYDTSFEDVSEKTKYDLFYVENMSLRMDIKILINTLVTVLKGKGQ
ncbi:MAG: sugar transferase [Balneolales bacterium]